MSTTARPRLRPATHPDDLEQGGADGRGECSGAGDNGNGGDDKDGECSAEDASARGERRGASGARQRGTQTAVSMLSHIMREAERSGCQGMERERWTSCAGSVSAGCGWGGMGGMGGSGMGVMGVEGTSA